jgi:hypothetical protein
MPFKDPRTGSIYLSVAEVARRWECRPENVSRFHCRAGGLGAIQTSKGWWVSVDDLRTYEDRLRKATTGKIKKLQRLLQRLEEPVEDAK